MKRILLADDHRIITAGLDNIIRHEFLQVEIHECRTGGCVWKKVQKTAYHLVILDIMMPGTDAFHLLKNIFAWRPGQKVIIFTMNSAGIYAQKYLALGVKAFINKEAPLAEVGKAYRRLPGLPGRNFLLMGLSRRSEKCTIPVSATKVAWYALFKVWYPSRYRENGYSLQKTDRKKNKKARK